MADVVTETTKVSWGSRLGGSLKGIITGVALVCAGVSLLFWNEGRSVDRAKALDETSAKVISLDSPKVDYANDGKVIHVTGKATTADVISDYIFPVVVSNSYKLVRDVEMYQWYEDSHTETKTKLGGGEEQVTTYTYHKKWSNRMIDSSSFKSSSDHINPSDWYVKPAKEVAKTVNVGDFRLSDSQIESPHTSIKLNFNDLGIITNTTLNRRKFVISQDGFYCLGENSVNMLSTNDVVATIPSSPNVGDIRITFKYYPVGDLSFIGEQRGDMIIAHATKTGSVLLQQEGIHSSESMMKSAKDANKFLTYLLRIIGLMMIYIGLNSVFGILAVLADVVPFIGSLVRAGVKFVCGVLALVIGLVTIAVAWMYFRPMVSIPLLVVAVGLIFLILKKAKAKAS